MPRAYVSSASIRRSVRMKNKIRMEAGTIPPRRSSIHKMGLPVASIQMRLQSAEDYEDTLKPIRFIR